MAWRDRDDDPTLRGGACATEGRARRTYVRVRARCIRSGAQGFAMMARLQRGVGVDSFSGRIALLLATADSPDGGIIGVPDGKRADERTVREPSIGAVESHRDKRSGEPGPRASAPVGPCSCNLAACPTCLSLDVRVGPRGGARCAYCGQRWIVPNATQPQPIGPDDSLLAYEAFCAVMARADAQRRRACR